MQRWLWLWLRQGRTQDRHWENVRVFPVYEFPACATWNVSLHRDKGCSRDTSCLRMPCAPAPCQGNLQGNKELERVTPSGGHKHPQSSWIGLPSLEFCASFERVWFWALLELSSRQDLAHWGENSALTSLSSRLSFTACHWGLARETHQPC